MAWSRVSLQAAWSLFGQKVGHFLAKVQKVALSGQIATHLSDFGQKVCVTQMCDTHFLTKITQVSDNLIKKCVNLSTNCAQIGRHMAKVRRSMCGALRSYGVQFDAF